MIASPKHYFTAALFILVLSYASASLSQTKYEVTPSISVAETYDDNINLTETNPRSDYITTVSPGVLLNILSEMTRLNLSYVPTFVRYAQEDQLNTTRHAATLSFMQNLQQYLRFDLTDTYLRSEDPIEDIGDPSGARDTRNKYQRNTFNAGINYLFGQENVFNVAYGHAWLDNEDVTLDDSTIQTPSATLTYWFNMKDGLELTYTYTRAEFSRDDQSLARDDFVGHAPGVRYNHRFSSHTSFFIGYNFTDRDFDGPTEDYTVHEGLFGVEHAISRDVSLILGGGYFNQRNEISPSQDGYSYNISLVKRFERGSFTIGGNGGWAEDFLEENRRDFIRYYSAQAGVEYRLMEKLNGYANAFYRYEKDSFDRRRYIRRGNIGLGYAILRWLNLSLDYTYADRSDDIPFRDYEDNRVILKLDASKLYRY